MQATDDFAIFIHYQVPVVTRITSLVYKKLVEMGRQCLIGTLTKCEEIADEIVAVKETEEA